MRPLSPENFNQLYHMASRGNVSGINNARSRGLNIDSVNSNGDTGLCVAAKKRDKTAFRSFLQAGANPSHPCTWEIGGFREFMNSVLRAPIQNIDTAVYGAKAGSSMSFTTKALIGAGVVAAAAGTAIALSGGGGGGGSKHSKKESGSDEDDEDCGDDFKGTDGRCYDRLDCMHGGVQVNGRCNCSEGWSGTLCQNAVSCPGYVSQCSAGYVATSDTCQAGYETMYKCTPKDCSGYYSSCEQGYHLSETNKCQSASTMYYACEPNTCDGFSLTTCTTGYAESDVCYTPVARYVKCDVCAEGYDYYGTNQCHKTLNCQNGSVQQGGVCVCAEGWGGVVCNVPSACEGFEYKTTCPTGYKQTDSCLSGGDTYVKCGACADGYGYYGTSECHKTLDCEHGTQRGDVCECEEGWGGTICSVPNTCDGYEYRQCPTGYKQTDSCLSGSTTYLKCEACADGYDYYGTRQCHKTLDCQNGGHQEGSSCICTQGWTGTLCNVPAACDGFEETCQEGYHQTTTTCIAGSKTYYLCEANACEGYVSSCQAGYHETSDTCQAGEETRYKCEINDCSDYQENCGDGYRIIGTCQSGPTMYYACEPMVCEGFDYKGQCPTGYKITDSCISGEDTYVKCDECAPGYDRWGESGDNRCYLTIGCQNHEHQVANECVCDSGYVRDQTDGKCYLSIGCEHGGVQRQGVCDCSATNGWSGEKCQTCAKGFVGQDGGCYDTLNCEHGGTQVNNACDCSTANGWSGATCGTCNGEIGTGDICYPILDCGEHGRQQDGVCACDEG